MKRLIISLLVFSIFVSCGPNGENNKFKTTMVEKSTQDLTLIALDTLTFQLDSLTSPKSWMFQFKFLNNTPYLFIANNSINAIQAYSFKSDKVEKVIRFQKEGPEANRLTENFYVHNWDSLFFISSTPNRISVFDSTASLIHTWPIALLKPYSEFTITTQEYYFRPYFEPRNTTIGFWMYPPFPPYNNKYFKVATAVEYNLNSNTYITYGHYPDNYIENSGTHVVLRPTNGYQTDVYSVLYYGASSFIYLYGKDKKELVKIIDAKSKHLQDGVPALQSDEPGNQATYGESIHYYLTTGCYEYMFANEDYTYNYRIVKHAGKFKDEKGRVKTNEQFEFSIMIFDKDFKLINEMDFPGSIYDFRQSFAFGDRVYLNLNNPLNENIDEDHLMFEVLRLQ